MGSSGFFLSLLISFATIHQFYILNRGCCGRDRMVVPIQSVPITTNVVRSNSAQASVLDTTLCDKVCGRSVVFSGYSGFLHQ
jgi:hypothetical protein